MKTTLLKHLMVFTFVALVGILINSCGEDTILTPVINPPDTACTDSLLTGSTIKGRVTFVDTNFAGTDSGTYLISAFPRTQWPPMGPPSAYDTLRINGNNLNYCYSLSNLPDGDYVVTVGYRKAVGGQSPVMSVYGCDTSHQTSCWFVNPTSVSISSTSGARFINMISWADTSKKVY